MKTRFCYRMLLLISSSLFIGCERAAYREACQEEELYGGLEGGPPRSTLTEELGVE